MNYYNIDRNKFSKLISILFYIFKSTGVIFLSSFSPDIFFNASNTAFNLLLSIASMNFLSSTVFLRYSPLLFIKLPLSSVGFISTNIVSFQL